MPSGSGPTCCACWRGIPRCGPATTTRRRSMWPRRRPAAARSPSFRPHRRGRAAASAAGMGIVMGAPNLVIGGSHSGNVSAAELVEHGLLDVFSSDYVPASLLHAAFLLHEGFGIPMPEAIAPVTRTPADLVGLADRGRLAPGLRADLVRVREVGTRQRWWRSGVTVRRIAVIRRAEAVAQVAPWFKSPAPMRTSEERQTMSVETGTDSDYGLLDTRYAIYFAPVRPARSSTSPMRGSAGIPTGTSGSRSPWSRASRRRACTRSQRLRATTASTRRSKAPVHACPRRRVRRRCSATSRRSPRRASGTQRPPEGRRARRTSWRWCQPSPPPRSIGWPRTACASSTAIAAMLGPDDRKRREAAALLGHRA